MDFDAVDDQPLYNSEVSVISFEYSISVPFTSTTDRSAADEQYNNISREIVDYVGECGVCYLQLPLRANHIYTLCGHLFCVRCLLKWWDTNTTCPLCRAELFEEYKTDTVEGGGADIINPDDEDIEGIWIRTDMRNGHTSASEQNNNDEHHQGGGGAGGVDDDDRTTDENNSSDGDDEVQMLSPRTQMNLYLHQDIEWNWSIYSVESDDYLIPHLELGEILGLRENREIAINLFARSRFRDTLLESSSLFMGRVLNGINIHKRNWTNTMVYQQIDSLRTGGLSPTMYEFVIRGESIISPVYEINIFGFMKDVVIVAVNATDIEYHDDAWENRCEYAFVADVFTPTDFYIGGNTVRSYGSYDITEGIINTHELVIPFSQIRRLYRIDSEEQI